jgi:NADH-quinone oxidoreductase subunit G
MPLIRIDDKEIEAAQGESLLRVALNHGIAIPYYCWHPALSVVGQCRMCLVDVKGAPKLQTACSTLIPSLPPDKKVDGKYDLVVDTRGKGVKKAQRGIMEFLLLNHPLDCPVCDQAGECRLQQFSYEFGNAASRLQDEKVHAPKRVDIGPHVVYDAERCIKCTRCIRFCQEITGTGELTLSHRGVHTIVETFPGRALDNPYSVCTVDICPVGALTSREFRFKERVWFLSSSNSVCPECSRGCAVRFDTYKGEVLRIVPRDNPKVNGVWMCDYGRLLSERLAGIERLDRPAMREGDRLAPLAWDTFGRKFVEKWHFHQQDVPKNLAVLLSGRMTLEEMAAWKALSVGILKGAPGAALAAGNGEDDRLLIRRDRRPNLEGARRLGIPVTSEDVSVSSLLKGKKVALIVREDPVGDAKGAEREALMKALEALDLLVVFDDRLTQTAKLAHVVVPLSAWHEMEGTTVNFQGVLQKTARAAVPPRDRRPFFEVVTLWLRAEGHDAPDPAYAPWFREVKKSIPSLEGLFIRDLLPHGIALK